MLNVHDLEKRWLRYKIKHSLPYILLLLLIIAFVGTAGYFFLAKEHKEESEKKEKPLPQQVAITKKAKPLTSQKVLQTTKTIPKPKKVQIAKKETIEEITTKETKIKREILKPSMQFMQQIEKEPKNHRSQPLKEKKAPKKEKKKVQKIHKKAPPPPTQLPKEEYLDNDFHISIQKQESRKDIQDVLKRFQKNNNPALSLFVAKKYYELGDYKQAYNYALVTNKINNDIEESWIIFAKSLVKLGNKKRAVSVLKKYINYSHSANAAVLLDEIIRGKFQ